MPKSLFTIVVFAVLALGQTSHAKHAYFSQQCKFTLDGVERSTDQSYFGDMFYFEHVWAEYIAADADPSTAKQEIAVTLISEKDGPKDGSSDGEWTTERWHHDERIVVRKMSDEAKARIGFNVNVGQVLDLSCENQIDEP